MKSIFLKLVIFILFSSPSFCKAQRFLDHFEPDNLKLNRLAWDKSIDQETNLWLQTCLDTAHHEIKSWALHVMGIHLEQVHSIVDPSEQEMENFHSLIIKYLNKAKGSNNIDSTLISFIDTTVFSGYHSHRATISHFLFDIVTIRQIKRIRRQGNEGENWANNLFVKKFGYDHQKLLLELAGKSKEEILNKAYALFDIKDPSAAERSSLGWVLLSYRGKFLNEFEQYYQPSIFNRLSSAGQAILLQYWSFNLDLINEENKAQILPLLKLKNSRKETTVIKLFKVMLKNLILNKTKQEHLNDIHELFDSEEKDRYMERLRQRMLAENRLVVDSSKQITINKKKESPVSHRGTKPESLVTVFDDCSEEELLEYLDENLKVELYTVPGFVRNQQVVYNRAAILLLGNMYYSKNSIHSSPPGYDRIVRTLITIGTLENGYSEATTLIYYLGHPAIPQLKNEFFNMQLNRADFATNKLIELKNSEVVNWMIRVIETYPDPKIKDRARLALKIMKTYRNLQTTNRGITKEESDRIAHELIDPYLKRNQ